MFSELINGRCLIWERAWSVIKILSWPLLQAIDWTLLRRGSLAHKEDVHGWISAQEEAVDHQGGLGGNGTRDTDQRNNLQWFIGRFPCAEGCTGLNQQEDGDRGHQSAEEDDTDRLDSCSSHWVFVYAGAGCHSRGGEHDAGRHEVHLALCKPRQQSRGPLDFTYKGIGCCCEQR